MARKKHARQSKQLASPKSTGGHGHFFEAHVQSAFATLMLTGGFAPALPCWPIKELKFQAKVHGYEVDDLVVSVTEGSTGETRSLLCQMKSHITFTAKDTELQGFLAAAWADYNNATLFKQGADKIALITGPLSDVDTRTIVSILDLARTSASDTEFIAKVERAHFSSSKTKDKLNVMRAHLQDANSGKSLSNAQLYSFLRDFYVLGFDLGAEHGVALSLLHSHMSQFSINTPIAAWGIIVNLVQVWNRSAGTMTRDNLPEQLRNEYSPKGQSVIPSGFAKPDIAVGTTSTGGVSVDALFAPALLVGSWDDNNLNDRAIIKGIVDGF